MRPRKPAKVAAGEEEALPAPRKNGNGRGKEIIPVTVHSFPASNPVHEPHLTRSSDSVALRPMTLEEAVKEAEFRDRDVFVFRDNEGRRKGAAPQARREDGAD